MEFRPGLFCILISLFIGGAGLAAVHWSGDLSRDAFVRLDISRKASQAQGVAPEPGLLAMTKIETRRYLRWGSFAGTVSSILSFGCMFLGTSLLARANGRTIPALFWVTVVVLAGAAAAPAIGRLIADGHLDQADHALAAAEVSAAPKPDTEPFMQQASRIHALSSQIAYGGIAAGVLLLFAACFQMVNVPVGTTP